VLQRAANTDLVRKGAAPATVLVLALVSLGACSSGGDDAAADPTVAATERPSTTEPASAVSSEGGGLESASAETTAVVTTPATAPPTTLSELREHADDVLAGMDAADPATVEPLVEIQYTDEGADAAAAAIAGGAAGDQLWAATWVYATSGDDPSVLVPAFAAADPSTRVLAAAGALALGDSAAGPVLLELLNDQTGLRESEPLVTVGDFAAYTLDRFVAGPDLPVATTPEEVATAWHQWWKAHEPSLVFDPPTRMWSAA